VYFIGFGGSFLGNIEPPWLFLQHAAPLLPPCLRFFRCTAGSIGGLFSLFLSFLCFEMAVCAIFSALAAASAAAVVAFCAAVSPAFRASSLFFLPRRMLFG
jgi:hypothetical protein